MTYNLAFWVYAYGLMTVAMILAFRAVTKIRKGDMRGHMRLMILANRLILFFVLSYLFKMIFLGREQKSDWSQFRLIVLYIHESLIGLMLISACYTRFLAHRFRERMFETPVSEADSALRRRHKRAGKWTLLFAVCALFTASMVLYGMFTHS